MIEKPIDIRYHFITEDDHHFDYTLQLDPVTLAHRNPPPAFPPEWAKMIDGKCSPCTLDHGFAPYCPAALSIVEVVESCGDLLSYTEVDVTVEVGGRTISKHTTVQKAISSLLGVHIATSGCPSMTLFKPMARFHQPFATQEETLFRVASSYMLAQYYIHKDGQEHDMNFDGLFEAYEKVHEVNMHLAEMMRDVSNGDANINALVLLDVFAVTFPFALQDKLEELAYLFAGYLEVNAFKKGNDFSI